MHDLQHDATYSSIYVAVSPARQRHPEAWYSSSTLNLKPRWRACPTKQLVRYKYDSVRKYKRRFITSILIKWSLHFRTMRCKIPRAIAKANAAQPRAQNRGTGACERLNWIHLVGVGVSAHVAWLPWKGAASIVGVRECCDVCRVPSADKRQLVELMWSFESKLLVFFFRLLSTRPAFRFFRRSIFSEHRPI